MQSSLAAVLLGLTIACTGQINENLGGGGGNADGQGEGDEGAVCGDGIVDGAEGCDDGNAADGDGCSSACSPELSPRIAVTLDQETLATELGKTENLAITVTSVDGFTGPVAVVASVDYGPVPGAWVITQSKSALELAANASDTLNVQVQIPSDSVALAGTLRVVALDGSMEELSSLAASVSVANQVTITIPSGVGVAIPHGGVGPTLLRIRQGAKVVFHNLDTTEHRIHGAGGIPHEPSGGGDPGGKYIVEPTGDSTWYCHTHNENNAKTYNIAVD